MMKGRWPTTRPGHPRRHSGPALAVCPRLSAGELSQTWLSQSKVVRSAAVAVTRAALTAGYDRPEADGPPAARERTIPDLAGSENAGGAVSS